MFIITDVLTFFSNLIIGWITTFGYAGIMFAMALESAFLPVPSEIIMPFAGFVVFQGGLNFWLVVLAGTVGNLLGSIAAYWVGLRGGRPFLLKYGKYLWIHEKELDRADAWFKKHGSKAIFVSRLLPVVRTVISLPAGVARMPFGRFCLYTFAGSLPWCAALTYVGVVLGEHWTEVSEWFRAFDWLVVAGLTIIVVWLVWKWRKKEKK